jgi:hypothetical protein
VAVVVAELEARAAGAGRVGQGMECSDVVVGEIIDIGRIRIDRALLEPPDGVVLIGLGVARAGDGGEAADVVGAGGRTPGPGAGAPGLDTLDQAAELVVVEGGGLAR